MAGETVTLRPTGGSELAITGSLRVAMEADWGDYTVQAAIASGPDVIGGVVGTRQKMTRSVSLPIIVQASTASDYLAAVTSLSDAAAILGQRGGTIARQVAFPDGTSEELELEVLECSLHPEEGWMQAHNRYSVATLLVIANPGWLADEELVATTTASTDSVVELTVPQPRGNLYGPGRIVIGDSDGTARRFAEIGGAFTQDPQQVFFAYSDFDISDTDATSTGVGGTIGGHVLNMTPIVSAWRPVGYLLDLPHLGSYRVRIRARGGSDDATAIWRVVWRSGNGPWEALPAVSLPDTANYYDLDAGSIFRYDNAETMDIRVDFRGSDIDTGGSGKLNCLTLTPSEVYSVGRGLAVEQAGGGGAVFDDLNHDFGSSLGGTTAPVAPATFTTWTEAGDAGPDWSIKRGFIQRDVTTPDTDEDSGQFCVLGDTATGACSISAPAAVVVNSSLVAGNEVRAGLVARYVDTSNWLMVVIRMRRHSDSYVRRVTVYKRKAGTTTTLDEFSTGGRNGVEGLFLSVDAAGIISYGDEQASRTLAADADLASPSGTLKQGKVGVYCSSTTNKGIGQILGPFQASTDSTTSILTEVVRLNGIGVFSADSAYAADTDSSDPIPFTPQGRRIWIPPYAGVLSAKVRSSDSEAEPDVGFADSTDLTLYARPAFASLSDTLV